MALKDTIKKLEHLRSELSKDLHKAVKGNKAASQRVRTGTIKLEKTAKKYRKESVACVKKCAKKTTCKKGYVLPSTSGNLRVPLKTIYYFF